MLSRPVELTASVPPLAVTVALLTVMAAELKALMPMVIASVWLSVAPLCTLKFPLPTPLLETLKAAVSVAAGGLVPMPFPVQFGPLQVPPDGLFQLTVAAGVATGIVTGSVAEAANAIHRAYRRRSARLVRVFMMRPSARKWVQP